MGQRLCPSISRFWVQRKRQLMASIPGLINAAPDINGVWRLFKRLLNKFPPRWLNEIKEIDVIGMVKDTNQRYWVKDKRIGLKTLYRSAQPVKGYRCILRSIQTILANGVIVKVVFVRNRNKKSEWLAILSISCTLTEQEIIRIYGMQ